MPKATTPHQREPSHAYERLAILMAGIGIGVLTSQILQRHVHRRRHRESYQDEDTTAVTSLPDTRQQIAIATTGKLGQATKIPTLPEANTELPLIVTVIPAQFTRGAEGRVRVETLPGATCTLEAVYSTRRHPQGFANSPATIVVNNKGVHEWVWEIGTGGAFVDLTVEAWLEDHDMVMASLRVPILSAP